MEVSLRDPKFIENGWGDMSVPFWVVLFWFVTLGSPKEGAIDSFPLVDMVLELLNLQNKYKISCSSSSSSSSSRERYTENRSFSSQQKRLPSMFQVNDTKLGIFTQISVILEKTGMNV